MGHGDRPRRAADFQPMSCCSSAPPAISRAMKTRLRQAGIPFYVVSGRGFYQAREVQDLVHMLRVLDNPLDDFVLAVVLRSPLVGVSDEALYWLSRDWSAWTEGEPYPALAPTEPAGWPPLGKYPAADRTCRTGRTSGRSLPRTSESALAAFYRTVLLLQGEMPAGQPLDLIDLILGAPGMPRACCRTEGGEQRLCQCAEAARGGGDFSGARHLRPVRFPALSHPVGEDCAA